MIELVMVIVIMAIAAAIVVPMASSASSIQLRSAANMVAADLEYAKSMSISSGQDHSVRFDPANDAYQIVDAGGLVIPHPVKKGFNYVVSFQSESRLDRVDIISASFSGGSTVTFDSLGSPKPNGGTVVLRAGGADRSIAVEPITGFIRVSD